MSGAAREETVYRCPDCDGILVITALPEGVLRAVLCKRCNRRHTVFLGGRKVAPPVPVPAPVGSPTATALQRAPGTPPAERGAVRARRR